MILMIPNSLHRLVEENNSNNEELSVVEMTQLEEELDTALMQTRSRKVILFHLLLLVQKIPIYFCF